MSEHVGLRGRAWFQTLTGKNEPLAGDPGSVLVSNSLLGSETSLFLCVVPNPESRFPCVRDGQVGLEEAYTLATRVREAIAEDRDKPKAEKRPIIAIVDVKSQAYGRREETAGIFLAAATSADAYASARMAGHPVISLVAGHAFSGGFLTHGYQANRILAFDDAGIVIHAMHKEAAARITRRSVAELERLGHEIAPMSYDVKDYAKLGLLYKLLHVENPLQPTASEIETVKQALVEAIQDARAGSTDLGNRLESDAAKQTRKASIAVRAMLEAQWQNA
ncbi:biotin-independent malonate decarboxylase subunit gamma [Granulicella mallensis]|uniref:Malonate decarboxylase, gamma subunit n=1 Tax=Granulicella mallensis (strain ATCC BAA-1857 / DSM 23137 / MP5ACTX8) TaxID=682795 RepID=G8NWE4_GRAMM|nr:biotin-independent malonate decarboxylase subunit gamma [Granulicella mallensis]AEU37747.1 malonate decarboxylase, gamma subunit [Granulicella mallensis MP5ACTX8]